MSSKKDLSERDICTKYITPAIDKAGWDIMTQVREEVSFTAGRVIVQGEMCTRGKKKRADYILYYKPNMPIAIIEAKDNKHSMRSGMQQGLDYGQTIDVPFIFSSNGDGFIFHDKTLYDDILEKELSLDEFPSPAELWKRYKKYKGIDDEETEKIITQDYFFDVGGRTPRYYQMIAINRTIEAIAKGQNRILLTMATGTGKTYTAFQIIWRLWKRGTKKRILFLADRNSLIDQTKRGDFKHFKEKMTKVKNHQVDKSYEIYLALYQGLTGAEEAQNIYKNFSKDFFDLIVIDECHRGSAAADSNWRNILDYFDNATHIGLTATPKETKEVSNSDYFGDPVYTYTLKQGIEDGFLAPYKVIRVGIDKDLEGWRPEKGQLDKYGNPVEDRIYNVKDYDRTVVLEKRTELVAKRVSEYLRRIDRFSKTIVFCVDIDHAERMRECLVNENQDLVAKNYKYVLRITGDNPEGKMELDNFINPEETYPVIATTSKLMTTGVDAQTCKVIVLDSNIQSMTEFKQIIGRGTRINEEFGKFYFTIMDFRNVTNLFADPDFDGEPIQSEDFDNLPEVKEKESTYTTHGGIKDAGEIVADKVKKIFIDGVPATVINERVQYLDAEGKLITKSLKDYTKETLQKEFQSLDEFLSVWKIAKKKSEIIKELQNEGILLHELQEAVGKELDIFDLICHVAFEQPPLTRKERAENVKKRNYFTKYGDKAKLVLDALLAKYADKGIDGIEDTKILQLYPFTNIGTPREIANYFGGIQSYRKAILELKEQLYFNVG